jgi:hypothetical protein
LVRSNDYLSFRAIKILVFDKIQPSKNLPLLFGRELNIQKKS